MAYKIIGGSERVAYLNIEADFLYKLSKNMQENLYRLNLACIKRGQAIKVWSLGVFSLSRALVITLSRRDGKEKDSAQMRRAGDEERAPKARAQDTSIRHQMSG